MSANSPVAASKVPVFHLMMSARRLAKSVFVASTSVSRTALAALFAFALSKLNFNISTILGERLADVIKSVAKKNKSLVGEVS